MPIDFFINILWDALFRKMKKIFKIDNSTANDILDIHMYKIYNNEVLHCGMWNHILTLIYINI